MDEFVAQSVKTGLRRMFRPGGWFNICEVRSCLDAAGIPHPPELKTLEPLHCVHWSEMEPGFRAEVVRRTMLLFDNEPFDLTDIAPDLLPQAPGFVARMLGKGKDA